MVDFAELDFSQPGQPRSRLFNDLYFSQQGALAESEHVFLTMNDLPHRWRQHPRSFFTIGETGFGAGINFLVAWEAFRAQNSLQRLHFVSAERYPIHPEQLAAILRPLQDQLSGVPALLTAYQHLVPGWNRISFKNAELTLWIGDAKAGFEDFNGRVDAWFLDGFSPACNPDLWSPQLFSALAQASHGETTFATYSVARAVREGLAAAGFSWTKQPGFGLKQHCLSGYFTGREGPMKPCLGWPRPKPVTTSQIAIVGGGLAAAELVNSALRRDLEVTVIAPQQHPLGNIQGAVYARPGLEADPNTQWYASALSYRLRRWQQVGANWPGGQTGLLQLMPPERWRKIQDHFDQHPFAQLCQPISADAASQFAGTAIHRPALWFATSGWISIQDYIVQQCQQVRRLETWVQSMHHDGSRWQLVDAEGQQHLFEQVILATGANTAQWEPCRHLPIQSVRGQITAIDGTQGPNCVICGDRYATPNTPSGRWHVGSTFQPNQTEVKARPADRLANGQALLTLAPDIYPAFASGQHSDAVGVRAASPDRLPIAGPLVQPAAATAHPWQWHRLHYQPGLWVMAALGSKGLTSAPLLAEYVIAQITGEPLPFGHQMEQRIHAERFWRKAHAQP